MKPIGTITKYFPFLEEETKSVLRSIMDEASDYYDFIVKLGHKACNEEVSPELAYMAALHTDNAKELDIKECLREKYKDRPEIVVWTFPMLDSAGTTLDRDEISNTLNRVIATDPPDWMLIEIHSEIEGWFARTQPERSEIVRKVESILDSNEDLACFEMYRHVTRSYLYDIEGESVKSILEKQKGLEIARRFDDVVWVMAFTGGLGAILKNYSTTDAIEYYEEYNKLSVLLGLPRFMELARNHMGIVYLVRGEYDMALECQFAACEVYYHDSEPSSTMCGVISLLYSDIGNGTQALHWAKKAFQVAGGKGDYFMHYTMARALLHLRLLEDAEKHVDKLHKLSLESASEQEEAFYLHARGLYELKSGKPRAAIDTLGQALSVIEPLNIQVVINRILISLAETEIQLAAETGSEVRSGQWLTRLESHARKKEYPGIQMQAALLRAELFAKQNRITEAQEVLQDALSILDSPSVNTLRTKIKNMLDDLIVV